MERINIKRALVLSLFSAGIWRREDFESPDKLVGLKARLEKEGYKADVSLDPEHNLYTLNVQDNRKKGLELNVDYEFCSQGDYQEYYRAYKRIHAYYEREIRVLNKDGTPRAVDAAELLGSSTTRGRKAPPFSATRVSER